MTRFSRPAAAFCGLSALVAVAACSDSNAPAKRPNIVLEVVLQSQSYSTGTDGFPLITCDVGIRATNKGNGTGTLGPLTMYFYYGTNRTAPLDTIRIDDAATNWNDATLDPNEVGESEWYAAAGVPFGAKLEFAVTGGPDASTVASVPFNCGPVATVTAPPSITSLAVSMPGGQTPGGTLVVDYAATAPSGLWYTEVTTRGPCELLQSVNDFTATSATHHVSIPVPLDCATGVPFLVTVTAWDIGLQGAAREVVSSFSLAGSTMPLPNVLALPAQPAQSSSHRTPCCRRSESLLRSPAAGRAASRSGA